MKKLLSLLLLACMICLIACNSKNTGKIVAEKKAKIDSIVAVKKALDSIAKAESKMKVTQIKGVDKYITVTNDDELYYASDKYEQWFFLNMKNLPKGYGMWFDKTPVGVKHALSKIRELCDLNGRDFDKPDIDNSLMPSIAKGIFDYEGINSGLYLGDGEIIKAWNIGNGQLVIQMDSKNYRISIFNH